MAEKKDKAVPKNLSRNPYHDDDGVPRLRESVLIYMDVLGYQEMVLEAQANGREQELLLQVHNSLTRARTGLEGLSEWKKFGTKDHYALKAFTDNIVVGWPVRDDAEIELGFAFSDLADFQFQMVLSGFFVRGALSLGNAFVDDIAVFGGALTEAYLGESRKARDPRIILTDSAVAAVKKHLNYYGRQALAPQNRDLLKDSDGQWFINYLDCVLIAEDEHGPFYKEFMQHKRVVESKLKEFATNPPIFAKYAWVAGYHNSFCDLHPGHFSDEHRVDIELFRAPPTRIVGDSEE